MHGVVLGEEDVSDMNCHQTHTCTFCCAWTRDPWTIANDKAEMAGIEARACLVSAVIDETPPLLLCQRSYEVEQQAGQGPVVNPDACCLTHLAALAAHLPVNETKHLPPKDRQPSAGSCRTD